MKLLRFVPRWIALTSAGIVFLTGCTSVPTQAPKAENVFRDELFGPRPSEVSAERLFALDADMLAYARGEMATLLRRRGQIDGFLDALYDRQKLQLEYDAGKTRNAAEAFAARKGNCLSLVVMTAAFAREVGLEVRFRQVYTDTEWRRQGDLFVSSGHINLQLDTVKSLDWRVLAGPGSGQVIDFLPAPDRGRQLASDISQATVTAMYMNNRAAESIADGQIEQAYWWARSAIEQDSRFIPSYGTLAIAYHRRGALGDAIRVLNVALRNSPEDTVLLSNQARYLREVGKDADAEILLAKLKSIEAVPPYHYFQRGVAAMDAKDYPLAREFFRKELSRQPYNADFHFGLAATYIAEADWDKARERLSLAREYSATSGTRALYTAKLEKLQGAKKPSCPQPSCDRSG